jgi:hypothetical protein
MGDSRQSTALHEAAHAVLCVLLEMPFTAVTIVPTSESAGAVHPDNEAFAGIDFHRVELLHRFAKLQMILYAGQGAVLLQRGPVDFADVWLEGGGAEGDSERITRNTEAFRAERDTFINCVILCTLDVLRIPNVWATIGAVATALIRESMLSAKQVAAICGQFLTEEDWEQAAECEWTLFMVMMKLAKDATEAGQDAT